jgi:hypothetical protein
MAKPPPRPFGSTVVKTRLYFRSHADWEAIAKGHGEVFKGIRPPSAFIQVAGFASPEWARGSTHELAID